MIQFDKCVFFKTAWSSCTSQNMSCFLVDSARKPGGLKPRYKELKTEGIRTKACKDRTWGGYKTSRRQRWRRGESCSKKLGSEATLGGGPFRGSPGCPKSWRFFFFLGWEWLKHVMSWLVVLIASWGGVWVDPKWWWWNRILGENVHIPTRIPTFGKKPEKKWMHGPELSKIRNLLSCFLGENFNQIW